MDQRLPRGLNPRPLDSQPDVMTNSVMVTHYLRAVSDNFSETGLLYFAWSR